MMSELHTDLRQSDSSEDHLRVLFSEGVEKLLGMHYNSNPNISPANLFAFEYHFYFRVMDTIREFFKQTYSIPEQRDEVDFKINNQLVLELLPPRFRNAKRSMFFRVNPNEFICFDNKKYFIRKKDDIEKLLIAGKIIKNGYFYYKVGENNG